MDLNALLRAIPPIHYGGYDWKWPVVAVAAGLVFLVFASAATATQGWVKARKLLARAARKRAQRDKRNQQLGEFLAKYESTMVKEGRMSGEVAAAVLDKDATELLEAMKSGELSSEQVTFVYCKRACFIGTRVLHATTEENYEEALAAARESDARRAQGQPARMLEGLPVSIKENFKQRGFDASCGVAHLMHKQHEEDGLLVSLIRGEGGIPFVRSNVPMLMMATESHNHAYGSTRNPWNEEMVSGGSSGGEAALVAARCSPLGLGSDIGGSIRGPASFCGLVGVKATPDRITNSGAVVPRGKGFRHFGKTKSGNDHIATVAGPLARSVRDAELLLQVLSGQRAHEVDLSLAPLPYEPLPRLGRGYGVRQVRVGVITADHEMMVPSRANQRAVREAAQVLRGVPGVEVVDFALPHTLLEASLQVIAFFTAQPGLHQLHSGLQGEPLSYIYDTQQSMARLPDWLRQALAGLLARLGFSRLSQVLLATKPKGSIELFNWAARRQAYRELLVEAMRDQGVDVILLPPNAAPAYPRRTCDKMIATQGYMAIFNLLNLPAMTLPVTRLRPGETEYMSLCMHKDSMAKTVQAILPRMVGNPVSVQLVSRPWKDEVCMQVAAALEAGLVREARDAAGGVREPNPSPLPPGVRCGVAVGSGGVGRILGMPDLPNTTGICEPGERQQQQQEEEEDDDDGEEEGDEGDEGDDEDEASSDGLRRRPRTPVPSSG